MSAIRQSGFSLVSAMFVLVVLTALGAYMLTQSGVQRSTVDRAILTARVYSGARGGLEWGIHQAVSPALGSGVCPATTTFPLSGGSLEGISVTVECSASNYSGAGKAYYIYYLKSKASYGQLGTLDYVERKIEATVCRSTNISTSQC